MVIIYVHLWKRLYTLNRELNHNQYQENSMLNESISFMEIEYAICIRNLMTQLRLNLEIETGRFRPIYDKSIKNNRKRLPSERICKICDIEPCENEFYFIFICPKYNEVRQRVLGFI